MGEFSPQFSRSFSLKKIVLAWAYFSLDYYTALGLSLWPTLSRWCLGCNNGVGGGNFSKVKRLVRKCIGTRKLLFSGFHCFSPCAILETQELFPKIDFTDTTTHVHLSLFMGCWNMQENLDSDSDGRLLEIFRHFALWRHGTRHTSFCHWTQGLHFSRRIF